jgi:hypothetical protein
MKVKQSNAFLSKAKQIKDLQSKLNHCIVMQNIVIHEKQESKLKECKAKQKYSQQKASQC